jgi:hypothetical protein
MKCASWYVAAVGLLLGVAAAPAPAQEAPAKPPVMKHTATGRERCMMCHNRGVMEAVPDVPEDHADRAVETCGWCHAADAAVQTKAVPPMSHDLAGREKCLMCHRQGVMEAVPDAPADHAGRAETVCGMCHQVAKKP